MHLVLEGKVNNNNKETAKSARNYQSNPFQNTCPWSLFQPRPNCVQRREEQQQWRGQRSQPLPPRESLTAQTIFPPKVCGQEQSPTSTLPLGFFLPKSCRTKHKQLPHIPKTILQQPQRAGALPAQSQPPAKVCGQSSEELETSSGGGGTQQWGRRDESTTTLPTFSRLDFLQFFAAKVKKY